MSAIAALQPEIRAERATYDVVGFVDITGSMNARDYGGQGAPQSRLDAVRQRLPAAIGRLPCGSRFGLGVFSERRVFLLFEPMDVCRDFAAIEGAIRGLDWRMAWEGDSRISDGLQRAIDMTKPIGADLIFLTDGHEAPPPRTDMEQRFEIEKDKVRGLLVGVGGTQPVPIPKYDDFGRESGFFSMSDVPQASRLGPPPEYAEGQELPAGYNARNAPFGEMPEGDEHLTSVKEDHLRQIGAATGLGYARLGDPEALAEAIEANAKPRPIEVPVDLSSLPAFAALLALAALYGAPLAASLRGRALFPRLRRASAASPSSRRDGAVSPSLRRESAASQGVA
ncbi:VWA domain-containing protein [Chenggangzhangella methanolivorans]|uniref:VWA domain-containing protein n=2 Tax=Chenggangzhangella methanolivorans TaxID=1437009 RepID=A0A9E6RDM0_9HYPH|nr:VWA domain-containing protein [Chenggangzhangella methanolivorans]